MLLFSVISNYQLLLALTYLISKNQTKNTVLLIGIGLASNYPNYNKLKEIFKDVIVFETGVQITNGKLDDYTIYFDNLLSQYGYNIKQFDNIYAAACHWRFGFYLIQKQIPFIFLEDGGGVLSRPEVLAQCDESYRPGKKELVYQHGLYTGNNMLIKNIICDFEKQTEDFEFNSKMIDFSLARSIMALKKEHKKYLVNFFIKSKKITFDSDSVIIFTEHFANLKLLSFEYQALVYQYLVDYFFENNKIIFKPHPEDIMYYNILFPNSIVIKEKFPAELLVAMEGIDFNLMLASISSTSVYNLSSIFKNIFTLDFTYRNKNVIDKTHKYYNIIRVLDYISKKLNHTISYYCYNSYDLLLNQFNLVITKNKLVKETNIIAEADYIIVDNISENIILNEVMQRYSDKNFIVISDELMVDYNCEPTDILTIDLVQIKDEDYYDYTGKQYIYFYDYRGELAVCLDYKFSKTLEYCGTNMCVSFSDKLENDKRILEAILEATNRRLELEVKKNKEQLGVKE